MSLKLQTRTSQLSGAACQAPFIRSVTAFLSAHWYLMNSDQDVEIYGHNTRLFITLPFHHSELEIYGQNISFSFSEKLLVLSLCWERIELTEWEFWDSFIVACCCCPLQCCCGAVKGALGRVWITWNLLQSAAPTPQLVQRVPGVHSVPPSPVGLNTNKIANYLHWSKCKPFIDLLPGQSGAHSISIVKTTGFIHGSL